jgi:osmotically inducible lipoprotein OsmB
MNRNLFLCCTLIGSMALVGCAGMSDTERRVTTGAAVGGAAAGVASGSWGWAAAGAAAGAAGGYLYDKSKKNEENAR